jgi:hypothetical protein
MPNQINQTFLDRLVAVEAAVGVIVAPGSTAIARLAAVETALGINYAGTAPYVNANGVLYDAPIGAQDRLCACEGKSGVFDWPSRQGSGGQYYGGR